MIYLTFGENPSGVYEGQVIDACLHMNTKFDAGVKLVAFISLRNFFENRKRIKSLMPDSIVMPMLPKISTWKWNAVSLFFTCLLTREKVIISRNLLATNLALSVKKRRLISKVCYDARGAIAAEWNEYNVVSNSKLLKEVDELERRAVQNADYRLAVSRKLVEYWKRRYAYKEEDHVIVPCTLSFHFSSDRQVGRSGEEIRAKLGWDKNDIVLVYAGSAAGWQSFSLVETFLHPLLSKNRAVKMLFLSKPDENIENLQRLFPDQVAIRWVKPEHVREYLMACDYGLLMREKTVTNEVAAPTKFAEYLASGLDIIISESLGDYTDFVKGNGCGMVVEPEGSPPKIRRLSEKDRKRNIKLASEYFTKCSPPVQASFEKLIKAMKG